jgi:isopropylmalate/homocitrate/citramalate synthase
MDPVPGPLPSPHVLLDTTLRDGEQAPGVALTPAEKAEYVRLAEDVGIRYLEIGFPQNPFDFDACAAAAQAARHARLVAMSLTNPAGVECVRSVGAHEVLFVVPSSGSHVDHVYGGPLDRLLGELRDSLAHAREVGLAVNVGLEDAGHRDFATLGRILDTLEPLAEQVDCVTVPDTRGELLPHEVPGLLQYVRDRLPHPGCRVAFHAHDDLGLATANSLAALREAPPVDCVHVTVCGYGERAGNASLEQLAVLLATRLRRDPGLDLARLPELARLAAELFLTPVGAHAPVVGWKVFMHESGLHQRALLEDTTTYQVLNPGAVGTRTGLVLGKHTGRGLRQHIAAEAGCPEEDVLRLQEQVYRQAKEQSRAAVRGASGAGEGAFLGLEAGEAIERLRRASRP